MPSCPIVFAGDDNENEVSTGFIVESAVQKSFDTFHSRVRSFLPPDEEQERDRIARKGSRELKPKIIARDLPSVEVNTQISLQSRISNRE